MVDTRFSVSVHIMTALAFSRPHLMSSVELAKGIKTNSSFIRKLVVSLSAAGLVESVRGKSGGIRLAKRPQDISLAQIYRAVAATPLVAVPGKTPNRSCEVSCGMGTILCALSQDIEEAALKMLDRRSLQDVLAQLKK